MDEFNHIKMVGSWCLLILAVCALFAVPCAVAILFGFAWTILLLVVVAFLLVNFGGKLGMNGGFEVVFFGAVFALAGAVIGLGIRWVPQIIHFVQGLN